MSEPTNDNTNENAQNSIELKPNEGSTPLKDKIESTIKIIGLLFTAGILFFTYRTYDAAQKWKVAEFTASKVKEFHDNKSVVIVNKLLDYSYSKISLDGKDTVEISDKQLLKSLRYHVPNGKFSDNEVKLRETFDEYFEQLSLFNRYAKAELISYKEMKPYLIYEIEILCDTTNDRKENELRYKIWNYINSYHFTDVKELCKNLGYDIDKKQ